MVYGELDILNAYSCCGKRIVSFRPLANQFSSYVNSVSGVKSAVFFPPISRFKRTFNYYTHPSAAALSRRADVPTYTLSSSYIIQPSHAYICMYIIIHTSWSSDTQNFPATAFSLKTQRLCHCARRVCVRVYVFPFTSLFGVV